MNTTLSIDLLKAQCSPALLKALNEVRNFYKYGIHIASIRHKITRQLNDA
jgi:hypothetical protein